MLTTRRASGTSLRSRFRLSVVVFALALLAAGCGSPDAVDDPAEGARPNISNVERLEPSDKPSRADEYRATATAIAAERANEPDVKAPDTSVYGEVFHILRMPAASRIQIPSLGIDAPVEDVGTEIKNGQLVWEVIENIVGHHRASANPGEPGNMVLTGHVESRSSGNIFLTLPDVQVGDEVIVTSEAGEFTYVVTAVDIRHESEIGVLSHGYDEKLTLLTCVPDGIYDHRVIVTALPVDLVASG